MAAVLAAALLCGCDQVPLLCRDELVAGVASPDGAHVAEAIVRDCHATTGYTLHVALRSSRDRQTGTTVAVVEGARPPGIVWRGARELVVSPGAGVRVLYRRPTWNGVRVSIDAATQASNPGSVK
jgi:hypothetical protein